MTHTPAPWHLEFDEDQNNNSPIYICHSKTQCDATTVCNVNTNLEDARLIAAAPELLEALEFLVNTNGTVYSSNEREKAKSKARIAIAKAKGEQ